MFNINNSIIKRFIWLLPFLFIISWSQDILKPVHHTKDGFRNPFPTFKSNHGFVNLFKWSIIERINGKKPERPHSYTFDLVYNDGTYLRL